MEGNLRFKVDWASLTVRRKLTVFALVYGGLITEGFLRYEFGGLIFGGAYFRNFTVPSQIVSQC